MKSWLYENKDKQSFFDRSVDKMTNTEQQEENEKEQELFNAFSKLPLLYDIPYCYLIPSEKILPKEHMGFFYLDSNWIRSLLDGAFSIGRNVGIDYKHDTIFLENIYVSTIQKSKNVRTELQKRPASEIQTPLIPVCTGFILNSQLVGGWRGLEFVAYKDKDAKERLLTLRLETLSENVLLGLFAGKIARLDILQPPEGLHYGFGQENGKLIKTLREVSTGKLYDEKNGNKKVVLKERGNRVIDIAGTAEEIKNTLEINVTSAHIALEMIQNQYMAEILID